MSIGAFGQVVNPGPSNMQGTQPAGSASLPNPLVMGGSDGTNVRIFKTDSSGVLQMNIPGTVTLGNLPQQPFLNVTDFNDVTAGTPTTGDIISAQAGKWARFGGNTTTTPNFYTSTGTGAAANAPTLTSSTGSGSVVLASGATITPGKDNGVVYLDGTAFAQSDAGFTAALTAAGTGGTVVIPPNVTVPISSDHVITSARLNIRCERGAIFNYTTAGRMRLQGVQDSIIGCGFNGPGVGTTGIQMVTMEADKQVFQDNVYTGFGSTTGAGILEAFAGSYGEITNNFAFNNADNDGDIFINNTTTATVMDGWRVTGNIVGSIIVHTTTGTANVTNITIANNIVRPGENSRTEYGIEVGAFGGATPSGLVMTGNTVYLQANGTNGGFSLSTINPPCSETGDTFFNNGFTFTISSFEHVLLSNCTVTSLSINEGTGGNGLTCDRCNRTAFSGISIDGFTTGAGGYAFHTLVSSTVGPSASDNVFDNMTIRAPAAFTGNAVWEQCNAVGATCNNNSYTNIHVVGTSGVTGSGLTLENDVGTMTNTTVNNSQFENLATGINQVGTRTNVKLLDNQFASVTTLYGGSLTGSFILDPSGAFTGLNINQNGLWGTLGFANLTGNRTYQFPDYSPTTVTGVVANGTATFTTTAVAAAACQTTVTVAGTGILTTDTITWAYNSQPTAGTDASLILNAWPTSGNVNFSRCNPTAASITPTAKVINWRVVR